MDPGTWQNGPDTRVLAHTLNSVETETEKLTCAHGNEAQNSEPTNNLVTNIPL